MKPLGFNAAFRPKTLVTYLLLVCSDGFFFRHCDYSVSLSSHASTLSLPSRYLFFCLYFTFPTLPPYHFCLSLILYLRCLVDTRSGPETDPAVEIGFKKNLPVFTPWTPVGGVKAYLHLFLPSAPDLGESSITYRLSCPLKKRHPGT
jgi:hypothetical protein